MANNLPQSTLNLGLGVVPEKADDKSYIEFVKVYNAIKLLASALDAYTGNQFVYNSDYPSQDSRSTVLVGQATRVFLQASVAIAYGQLVSIDSTGKLILAINTSIPAQCRGVCVESGGIAAGAYGEIRLQTIVSTSGLTPGTTYYTSGVAGSYTSNKPSGSGNYIQPIGFSIAANALYINPIPV